MRSNKAHSRVCRERLERVLRHHPVFGPRITESNRRLHPEEAEPAEPAAPQAEPADPQNPEIHEVPAVPPPAAETDVPMDVEQPDAADTETAQMEDGMMALDADPNEISENYVVDWRSNELESKKLDGVEPKLITAAKVSELNQLQARSTFEVISRKDLLADTPIIGTRWVVVI